MDKVYISANDFTVDSFKLARLVMGSGWQPDVILALWRGGAIPGVVVSEAYRFYGIGVQHYIIKCGSYNNTMRGEGVCFDCAQEVLDALPAGAKVLVVDDVFDSGKTAEAVLAKLVGLDVRLAMVYWKPEASLVAAKPDYTIHQTNNWIVFPHEVEGLSADELAAKDSRLVAILSPLN